jgi:molecular chaperone GrpE
VPPEQDLAGPQPGAATAAEPAATGGTDRAQARELAGAPQAEQLDERCGHEEPPGLTSEQDAGLAEISAAIRELADSSERYHLRAEQREAVIDHLREEVERLRRGERRGLLRPLLVEICRLRNDLLRQADNLPAEYTADQAAQLLRSYAETVELILESGGVVAFEPEIEAPFDPRRHRRVGAQPTGEPALAGRIASVRRSGYLDVDADSPVSAAEVVLFAAVTAAAQTPPTAPPRSLPSGAVPGEMPEPASSTDERDEL